MSINIVAYITVARQQPKKKAAIQQPLLGNDSVNNGRYFVMAATDS
jgi:hypothetical protein